MRCGRGIFFESTVILASALMGCGTGTQLYDGPSREDFQVATIYDNEHAYLLGIDNRTIDLGFLGLHYKSDHDVLRGKHTIVIGWSLRPRGENERGTFDAELQGNKSYGFVVYNYKS